MTTLVVASRISTVMNLDKILVLDEGKVVGYDSHKVEENVPHLERKVSHTLLQSGIVVSVEGSH